MGTPTPPAAQPQNRYRLLVQILLVAAVVPQPLAIAGRTARPLKQARPVITELSEMVAFLVDIEYEYRTGGRETGSCPTMIPGLPSSLYSVSATAKRDFHPISTTRARAVREKITGTMVVSIDAGKVPTRANERVDDDGNKNYDREYRDAKVATVSALEWDEKRAEAHCTKTSCVTGIEHADQFFPRIEVEMKRRSAELATLILVVLGDGASWIWDRVADLAEPGQQVWYILDFWHACDHLAKICRVLYGEDTKPFTKQFERWRRMLRKSGVAAVISELKQLRDSGSYPGAGDDIQKQINYFTANKERMDYQRYRELRLPIGSGTVETACKNVVAARLKQSGMMWSVDGAKGMLQLRASLKSRRLMSDFDSLLPLSPTQETDLKAA